MAKREAMKQMNLNAMTLAGLLVPFLLNAQQTDNPRPVIWNVDNISTIGGHPVTVFGAPLVKQFREGRAVEFDGIDDGLIVQGCPINGSSSFTIEIIFMPYASFPNNVEQRFLHVQNPKLGSRRALIETRLTDKNQWFVDTHIRADSTFMTCLAEKFPHPVDQWYHVALVYENGVGRHYVNGAEEMSGRVPYIPVEDAQVSLGMRMNRVSFFKGAIRSVAMTGRALRPEEFLLRSGSPQRTQQNSAASSTASEKIEFSAGDWLAEFEDPPASNLLVTKNMIEVNASAGATVWYKKKLSGDVLITYDVMVIDSGGRNDRVSDLNAFWMASDPARDTPFKRNGKFSSYDDLDLYYAGVGGHDNTTTRFRRYRHGKDKTVLYEHTDKTHLLEGNKAYSVKIMVRNALTLFSINDVQYFEYADEVPLREGYFAFRTTRSRQRFTNFKIERLSP